MNRYVSLLAGILLILLGGLFLAVNLASFYLGFAFSVWRMWPAFILLTGATFACVPLLYFGRRWSGVFFIPASLVLTIGGILMVASLSNVWGIWAWAWALLPLALTAGFLLAALFMRNGWLAIPAIPIGVTAVILCFCAVTGWWSVWAWAWTLEIMSVGLMIAYVGHLAHNPAAMIVGTCFIGAGLALLAIMLSILSFASGFSGLVASLLLILLGSAILLYSLVTGRKTPVTGTTTAAS